MELGRDPNHIKEDAIDAIADQAPILIWLDVDVRGTLVDGLDEHVVDQPDDWREIDLPFQLQQIERAPIIRRGHANGDPVVLLYCPFEAPPRHEIGVMPVYR